MNYIDLVFNRLEALGLQYNIVSLGVAVLVMYLILLRTTAARRF